MVDVMLMEALLKAVPNHAAPPARGLNEKIIPLKRWHGLVDPLKIKELPHVQRDVSSLCTSKLLRRCRTPDGCLANTGLDEKTVIDHAIKALPQRATVKVNIPARIYASLSVLLDAEARSGL
jgi:hypothetical protein